MRAARVRARFRSVRESDSDITVDAGITATIPQAAPQVKSFTSRSPDLQVDELGEPAELIAQPTVREVGIFGLWGAKLHPYLSDSDKLAADYTMLVRKKSYKWRLLRVPHLSFYDFP